MKRNTKLQTKVSLAFFSMAILLSLATITATYVRYTASFEDLYIELTTNVATTAAQLFDAEDVLAFRESIMEIYDKDPAPTFANDEEYEAYLQQYEGLHQETKDDMFQLLDTFKRTNALAYLYVTYVDKETMSVICLVNADDEEYTCPTGVWDQIHPANFDYVDTETQEFPAFISSSEEFGTLCSAGIPIVTEDGEIAAHVFVDISMDEIIQDRVQFMYLLISLIIASTAAAILMGSHWIGQIMVKPINALAQATRDYVDQQEHGMNQDCSSLAMLDIKTGDEIEHLASSIQQMESDINNYVLTLAVFTAERERISAELTVATNIQANMLPSQFPAFPDRFDFDLFASMTPAKEVGGDFYDYFLVDDDHLALIIADVSGKGVPAALFMVVAKTLLKNAVQSGQTPDAALIHVNNQLCENNKEGMFVTTWIGVVELSTGIMTCSSAGHEYPAIQRKGEVFTLHKQVKHGFVLGGLEDMFYKPYEIQLHPDDVLFLYTDGVGEAITSEEELFGHDRMLNALQTEPSNDPKAIITTVSKVLAEFVGDAPQFDDITMLCFRYHPKHCNKKEANRKEHSDENTEVSS